jgi:hypothetical protein
MVVHCEPELVMARLSNTIPSVELYVFLSSHFSHLKTPAPAFASGFEILLPFSVINQRPIVLQLLQQFSTAIPPDSSFIAS